MKLVEQSFEIIPQEAGLEGIYKQIEKAGRTCYKSEDKITEDSAKKFVDMLTTNCHGAMLEHGTVYLTIPDREPDEFGRMDYGHVGVGNYSANKYSKVTYRNYSQEPNETQKDYCSKIPRTTTYVTTNLRVLVENGWMDDLQYISEPTEYHEKRITVKFTTDQGILREFTRHRVFSFAVESTRYCNYSKDKFGNEITFIVPWWCTLNKNGNTEREFYNALQFAEDYYFKMLELGWKPQQARNVLPLATKCDMIMTGFVSDWKHFFELRCDTAAHPQARELAVPLQNYFKENGYI